MDTIAALLREAELCGLTVTADGQQLQVSGPPAEAGLVERLRQRKTDVLAYLSQPREQERPRANLRMLTWGAPQQAQRPYLADEREAFRRWLRDG